VNAIGRGHYVFIVKRNSITTSDAADKLRVQCIKVSGFWRSGNQGPRKGKGGWGGFGGGEAGKIRIADKKSVACHVIRGATDAESGGKDCLKQRPMSRNLELRRSNAQAPAD
jgi:hypothetical protein